MVGKVLAYIRRQKLLRAGDRVAAAVSGGADSVALLLALMELRGELGITLSVAHFHHGIRGKEADADAAFVAGLAGQHGLEFFSGAGDAPTSAQRSGVSLETAARQLRYEFFRELMSGGKVDKIALAHTKNDQAETVLMRMIRGAGTRGVAGIYPAKDEGHGKIVRPLLETTREEIETFLKERGQAWREDSSNKNTVHTRNKVRHELLPLLGQFNPGIVETLARAAETARGEEEYWHAETDRLLPTLLLPGRATRGGGRAASTDAQRTWGLDIDSLKRQPLALQRRLIRAGAEACGIELDAEHVERVLAVAALEAKGCELPGEWQVERSHRELRFERKKPDGGVADYGYVVPIPGQVFLPHVNLLVHLHLMPVDRKSTAYNLQAFNGHLAGTVFLDEAGRLAPLACTNSLSVRNWREGDRFRQANSRSEKKVKDLLQELKVPPGLRASWPVVGVGDKLIWVKGTRPLPLLVVGEEGGLSRLMIEAEEAK